MIMEHREADEDFLQTLKSAEITDEDIILDMTITEGGEGV